jgi:hypothetical protein
MTAAALMVLVCHMTQQAGQEVDRLSRERLLLLASHLQAQIAVRAMNKARITHKRNNVCLDEA